ncbi:toll/interleukin-1 receptor domain-containing protein [Calothrix sp. PCC 7507]|uniref:toll/interleukin-1 receptor domain-containing protein n=1 Tax=Calothrix sp. PCC 7507 TaxID=99598 RepID=UPI00029F1DAD|nr:toll/interleukin-1 receptor domain-containing protein [Calothrix sp. PCC 7507]AFY35332.1 hypothetical protein Cal7507_4981 [Calothrix sp. PCC 7507]
MDNQEALELALNRARHFLQILEVQKAGYGIRVPVDLVIELEEKQKEVASLEARLIQLQGLQPQEANREFNPQVTQLQWELERNSNESPKHRLPESQKKEVFISYTWRDEQSPKVVAQIEQAFQETDIKIIRDSNTVGYKGRFQEFMQRLSRGKCVIVVISDEYLKSPNCMYEMVEIEKNGEMYDRIFPIFLADAQIHDPVQALKYIGYWENKTQELDEEMKKVSGANLQGFQEKLNLYTKIREKSADIIKLLSDMNALTLDIHSNSGFQTLRTAIENRLNE